MKKIHNKIKFKKIIAILLMLVVVMLNCIDTRVTYASEVTIKDNEDKSELFIDEIILETTRTPFFSKPDKMYHSL